ncbi:MAG: mandelate racemase/muconate lactonizing enzyme family protein [Planctomycetota bacterium]|nr:mandelate racemase/muconate lactonizing enzyme family protein [Planctomycetota bacterium]
MPQPTFSMRILEVRTRSERMAYRTPIKFGGRTVTEAVLFHVEIDVEINGRQPATGFGSMPLGNVWAWPSSSIPVESTLQAMQQLAEQLAHQAAGICGSGHPLQLSHRLAQHFPAAVAKVTREMSLPEPIPQLAQLVSASPIDAALHDAYGRALGTNSYLLLGKEYVGQDLSEWLGEPFRGEYLDQYVHATPRARMPLYHLVGALDPLTAGDIAERLQDGLPETLGEWILADGLTHLKIKLNGDQLDWDVSRVVAIEQVAEQAQRQRHCGQWWYSLDFNERCANVAYILEFLAKLKEISPSAWDRVQYIEQPTHRNLRAYPENKMHAAAALKPVVIDESLVDLDSLLLCREMGYTGVALKACKGHSEALLMGAAAQKYGLFLCVQDLTCPGFSFLHSASLAARIPTVAAIEGNARQYCPAGNRGWNELYPSMFRLADGSVETGRLTEVGLGFSRSSTEEVSGHTGSPHCMKN